MEAIRATRTLGAVVVIGFCVPGVVAQAAGWAGVRKFSRTDTWRAHQASAARPQPAPEVTESDSTDPFNQCKRAPGKAAIPVTLKTDTDVIHLIRWISSITCKAFVWSSGVAAGNRRVTIVAPATVTSKQAFELFLDAMNSIGLTVQPSAGFYQVIEAYRAKLRAVPTYDWAGHRIAGPRP